MSNESVELPAVAAGDQTALDTTGSQTAAPASVSSPAAVPVGSASPAPNGQQRESFTTFHHRLAAQRENSVVAGDDSDSRQRSQSREVDHTQHPLSPKVSAPPAVNGNGANGHPISAQVAPRPVQSYSPSDSFFPGRHSQTSGQLTNGNKSGDPRLAKAASQSATAALQSRIYPSHPSSDFGHSVTQASSDLPAQSSSQSAPQETTGSGRTTADTDRPIDTVPNGTSELSSLAKLREFKASISSSRSQSLATDVDSTALEEMAASFLASTNAVPPTPITVQAIQLASAPALIPSDTSIPGSSPIPHSNEAGASSTEVTRKSREQELREKLKAAKLGSKSPMTTKPPTGGGSAEDSVVKPDADIKSSTKHKLEEGELAEHSKRVKAEPPNTATTTSSSARTAEDSQSTAASTESSEKNKRKRAAEWMKTTGSQESVLSVKSPALGHAAGPVPGDRSLDSRAPRDERDTKDRAQQAPRPGPAKGNGEDTGRPPSQPSARPLAGSARDAPQKTDSRARPESQSERESKPSLAERIGPKDHVQAKRSPRTDSSDPARDRRDSVTQKAGTRYDLDSRRSRSPSSRHLAGRNREEGAEERWYVASTFRPTYDRDDPPYVGRSRSPPPPPPRDLPRDDRASYDRYGHDYDRGARLERPDNRAPSSSNYQAPPAPRAAPPPPAAAPVAPRSAPGPAPVAPLDSVAETLSLLKAQIARLESQIPAGSSTSSAPAPAQASQARYPPAPAKDVAPAYQDIRARPAPPASEYRGYDNRRGEYARDREASPGRLAPSAPRGGYERSRPLTPIPQPLHAHTRGQPPPAPYDSRGPTYDSRYDRPADTRPLDRERDRDYPPPRDDRRGSVGYDSRSLSRPTYDPGYGGYDSRAPPPPLPPLRDSPPRPAYQDDRDRYRGPPPPPAVYDRRDDPRDSRDPRDRYDPRPPPARRYDSPPPPAAGSVYSRGYDDPRAADYEGRYAPPPPPPAPYRPPGGYDNRAPGRGGANVSRGPRGSYDGGR